MSKRIATRALDYTLNAPWAIRREALTVICNIARRHNDKPEAVAADLGRPLSNTRAVTVRNGVASIPVNGPLFRYANLFSEISGATSYEDLATDFTAAIRDDGVRAILLAIDSPGGEVNGCHEMANLIFQARGKKPIVAYIGGVGASAAYWLASACDKVIVSETALAGNLGVLMSVTDTSEAISEDGTREIEFVSSQTPNKVLDPGTKSGQARIQSICDKLAAVFLADVAKFRGVALGVVEKDFGRGDVMVGADAVRAGLADSVGMYETTHAKLAANGESSPALVTSPRRAAAPEFLAEVVPAAATLRLAGLSGRGILDAAATVAGEDGLVARVIAGLAEKVEGVSPAQAGTPGATLSPADTTAEHKEDEVVDEKEKAAAAAESDRRAGLLALGTEFDLPTSRVAGWVSKNVTVEAATRELASEFRAGARTNRLPAAGDDDDAGKSTATVRVGEDRALAKPFSSFGEQVRAVIRAGMPGGATDPRLRHINRIAAGTPSGMNEGVSSEGGFFIQPELLPGVLQPVYAEDPIISRVTKLPISGNSVKFNVVDETSRATGSRWGAIQMYWVGEADTATPKAPKLRQIGLDLKKLMGIAYLTNELVEDAPASETLLTQAFRAEVAYMLGIAVLYGEGAGQPLGLTKSGAIVSQAIEATQTIANSNQFIALNVSKMLARVPASLWGDVIYLYQQELLPTLITAQLGTGSAVPLFMPVGGLANRPSDTILGRAAFASELCEAVGTPNDILAVAPSQYVMADKGGPNQATSLHVRFLYDEMALRIVYRVDGQPLWSKVLTPFKGANTRSPYVNLAVRS